MIQGSSMTRSHKGMRNGISLVEMLIAIVLFGVLAVISFKYVKVFYDTDLAAKQARVAALVEQGTQLTNAYDIYTMKTGVTPTAIGDLNASNIKILSEIPTTITEIGTTGWTLETATDYTGSGNNDIAFSFTVDNVSPATTNEEYCAVYNNFMNSSLSLDVTDSLDFTASALQYAALGNTFCFGQDGTIEIVLVKVAN